MNFYLNNSIAGFEMIEIIKILFTIPFLLYSCYSDMKTRSVSNRVWKCMLVFGSVFVFYEILIGRIPYLKALFLSGIIVFCSVYILFQLGAIGGGDAKGLIVLSILFPLYPIFHFIRSDLSPTGTSYNRAFYVYCPRKCSPDDNSCSFGIVLL